MMTLGKSEQPSEGLAYDLSVLQVLEGFLLSQVPLVTFDEVGTVLDLLADVRGRISGSQATAPTREDYESLLAAITDGTYSLPKTSEDLAAAMETLSDLKEYTAKRPKDGSEHVMSQQIDDLASQAQSQLDFLSLSAVLTTQKESTRDACTTSATIAEYKLQECEQILRQMVARYAVTHPEQVSQELKSLRDLARSVVEAKSEESWKAIISQLDSIKSERGAIGTSPDGDQRGVYQKKLDNIQQEASLLQNALPGLVGGSLELAVTRMNSLKEEARELSTNQSREYNAWAMERIRACLNKGGEGVGVFANGAEGRKTIGRALISELGPIDRRHLTTEVSRCLDEVMGKYLAPNQLNPVKKGSDLEEEGTILFTLNGMHQVRKRQLSDF
jgi:hypothetical protein